MVARTGAEGFGDQDSPPGHFHRGYMTLFDRYDRMRRGADVQRYHTHRMSQTRTVGYHSWAVAVLCDLLWTEAHGEDPSADMLLAALHHDLTEYDTGDVPAWVKRRSPMLKATLDSLEDDSSSRLDLCQPVCAEHVRVIKLADGLEHFWTCLDERRAGNTEVDVMFARGMVYMREKLKPQPRMRDELKLLTAATALTDELEDQYCKLVGSEHYARVLGEVMNGTDYFSQVAAGEKS
jgi:5'-deoxynucleotidase YfbR-like HD superfamily hydrolase